jgi:hypothetical protein
MIAYLSNFAAPETCDVLSRWYFDNPSQFRTGTTWSSELQRLVSDERRRIIKTDATELPQDAHAITSRLRQRYPMFQNPFALFAGGIAVSAIYAPGDFYTHTDTKYKRDGLSVVGCNLLVSEPEGGGIVTVSGQQYQMRRGDMMAYPITDYEHGVSPITGNKPRVMWHWRFYCDLNDWESRA